MNLLTLALLVGGLIVLVVGAEIFVRGASRVAAAAGISPLVIGLTVVAFGTSSPEVAVSVQSAYAGSADLALGNVVGSNIFNILAILGLSAVFAPLVVDPQLVRFDVPLMIGLSFLVPIIAFDGSVGRIDGILLVSGGVAYTAYQVVRSRRANRTLAREFEAEFGPVDDPPGGNLASAAMILGGLAMLVVGSRWLVSGATTMAEAFGVSDLVIGLTIVAAGTSLPEVATSVIATIRGERDIAVGNVIGSNIFNILVVLGVSGIVSPAGIPVPPAALRFDVPVMIAVAIACLPIFFTGNRIDHWEGVLFLAYFLAYNAYVVLAATEHDALPVYSSVMILFVLPLTGITLLTLAFRAWRSRPAVRSDTG